MAVLLLSLAALLTPLSAGTLSLTGKTGWTAVLSGANHDPVNDTQAGAADTDIVGNATHAALYTAYDDNGTASVADDTLVFRMRIGNPTGSANFGGVAVVGMDVNNDGRIDIFMNVDGRNNTRAVRLLDPGTGLNNSPNTTTTAPLPSGWLASNGLYPMTSANYNASDVSSATDPNWDTTTDIGTDGGTDLFISWRIPMPDLTTVLATASPADRNGTYGPRGSAGLPGFSKTTSVKYVAMTQTQNGPINGDIGGVGASYDKNATFSSLSTFSVSMSPSQPVSSMSSVTINTPVDASGTINDSEDNSVTVSGSATANGWVRLVVTDSSSGSVTAWAQANGSGVWSSTVNLSALAQGTLTFTADLVSASSSASIVAGSVGATTTSSHDSISPAVAVASLSTSGTPTVSGTSDLPNGSLITVTVDHDNDNATAQITYQTTVSSSNWSINTSTVAPSSGTVPAGGFTSYAKVTASATDVAGNTTTATAITVPTVNTLTTRSTRPTLTGNWAYIAGDTLQLVVGGATYTVGAVLNNWSLNLNTATPVSGTLSLSSGQTYSVTATVTRSAVSVTDTTSGELSISSTTTVTITGGSSVSTSNPSPTISGTSANAGSFVIVRIDPGNDGNLSDAVTYSATPDGSGNWSVDTASASPISGVKPSAGYVGANGILASDSTGQVTATQTLTVSTPSIAISSITSTVSENDAYGKILNTGSGASWLNMTEDNQVQISGTATAGFTVSVSVTDPNGRVVEVSGLAVSGGAWSTANLDLSSLDNGVLTVTATLDGTAYSAANTSVTHDKIAPRIFITTASVVDKTSPPIKGIS